MNKSLICGISAKVALLFVVAGAFAQQPAPDAEDPPDTSYFTGLREEAPADVRNFSRAPNFRAFLPESVDLSRNFPSPGNQGHQGSCVGWSVGYAARSYYVSAGEGRSLSQRTNIPSPAYIYNLAVSRSRSSSCDQGMVISDALNTLKEGAVSLADYPYDSDSCSAPPSFLVGGASQFKIQDWQFIAPREIDTIKGELAQGNPVVFGMRVTRGFSRHRGGGVYERADSGFVGGHAMVLIGYDERRQAFRVQNSWGRGWGDRGYAWLAYSSFSRDSDGAYVMRVGNAPRPSPGPGPGPDPTPAPGPAPEIVSLDLECSKVGVASENGKRIARGFVGKAEDLLRVREKLPDTDVKVDVRPWPQCEALLTLDRALSAADHPSISVASATADFSRGDTLAFKVVAPRGPSHLHVIYFQADGSVVHLLQANSQNLKTFENNATMTFGDGKEGRPSFRVSAPFGPEMALVLASRSPIFPEPRPAKETEREFLTALRRSLLWNSDGQQPTRDVSAAFVAVTTKDK